MANVTNNPASYEDTHLCNQVNAKAGGDEAHYVGTQTYHFMGGLTNDRHRESLDYFAKKDWIEAMRRCFQIYLTSDQKLKTIVKEHF